MAEEKVKLKWDGQLGVIISHNVPAINLRIDTDEQRIVEVDKEQAEVLLRIADFKKIRKTRGGGS